jgi:hypothetical protein
LHHEETKLKHQILQGVIHGLCERYEDAHRQLSLPPKLLRGLDFMFSRLFPANKNMNLTSSVPEETRSREAAPIAQKAGRFWIPMLALTSNQLSLPTSLRQLFDAEPADFFADGKLLGFDQSWRQDRGGQMMTLFRYHQALDERSHTDRARKVVMRLALQEALKTHIETRRIQDAIQVKMPMLRNLYASLFRDQQHEGEGVAGSSRDAPHPQPPNEKDFISWFRKECTLADRYSYLAHELGAGALLFLLDHFTDHNLLDGLAKTRKVCTNGIAHLQSLDLCEREDVLDLNNKVGELKEHVSAEFNAVFGSLDDLGRGRTLRKRKRTATAGNESSIQAARQQKRRRR